jgi:hypothetical protein
MRHELEFEKILAVGAQRNLVVEAGGHVAEMRGRGVLAAHRFEVEHIDRVLWTIDQCAAARRRPYHRIGQFGRRFHAVGPQSAGCQQWASSEVLQKTAAAGGANDRRRHRSILPCTYSLL